MTNATASNVAGKRILITGGASGIGLASALLLASRGAKVLIGDLNETQGQEAVKQAKESGDDLLFHPVDVSNADSVKALFAFAMAELGGLDVVINNAGVDHQPAPMHELSDDDFDRTIAINLKGVWHCMRMAIACMVTNGGGQVINIASVAGIHSAPTLSAYSASKHGVVGLTKTAAAEYAKVNMRFNAVCPSFIDTPMVRNTMAKISERSQQAIMNASPLQRLGTVDEIASAIAWMVSDENTFMNGHLLTLDGGMVA